MSRPILSHNKTRHRYESRMMPTTASSMTVPARCGQPTPPTFVTAVGYLFAAWCVAFALVNAWDLVSGNLPGGDEFAGHAAGLTVMSLLVLVLKLVGAFIAVAAVRPRHRPTWLLGAAIWSVASLLTLYSAGNLATAARNLVDPTEAWDAAGGLTVRAVAYLAFFLAGAAMSGVLAASYQRRNRPHWTAPAAGLFGAPAVLVGVLVIVPAALANLGLLPS